MAYYSSVSRYAFPGEISVLRIWIKADQTKNPIKRGFQLKGVYLYRNMQIWHHMQCTVQSGLQYKGVSLYWVTYHEYANQVTFLANNCYNLTINIISKTEKIWIRGAAGLEGLLVQKGFWFRGASSLEGLLPTHCDRLSDFSLFDDEIIRTIA